jgi:hypothetical protein
LDQRESLWGQGPADGHPLNAAVLPGNSSRCARQNAVRNDMAESPSAPICLWELSFGMFIFLLNDASPQNPLRPL